MFSQKELHLSYTVSACTDISTIDAQEWDACFEQDGGPCLSYAFLLGLELSNSVGEDTGWLPYHLCIKSAGNTIAWVPGYIKTHSYGEYIFDHAWANAYAQHGFNYYPKWVNAIPFTPVTSQRIGWINNQARWQDLPDIIAQIKDFLYTHQCSSMHLLFANLTEHAHLSNSPLLHRLSLQFEWQNKQYTSFSDYLAGFTSRKRRSITKERKKNASHNVTVSRIYGDAITQADMDFFYSCYRVTYLKRSGHDGYLTREFFNHLLHSMPQNVLLVLAKQDSDYIAGSLFLFDDTQLYGRYWGALQEVDGLHFECCYYQGIEFAIEHRIQRFNPGTQGEHKILRGFAPTYCHSYHSLARKDFEVAVDDFLQREQIGVRQYKQHCDGLLPFKQTDE